jgi:hypothetical protein
MLSLDYLLLIIGYCGYCCVLYLIWNYILLVDMVHDSRQVVLGLRVEQVVSEVDPVNCHPPALAITLPPATETNQPPAVSPAATEFDVTSSFLRAENFQTRDELIKWVRERGRSYGLQS